MIYVYNLGYQLNTGVIGGVLIGALYLILGNFIPKIKPNYSIGFRVPWAYAILKLVSYASVRRKVYGDRRYCFDRNFTISKCVDTSGTCHYSVYFAGNLFVSVLSEGN